jgi:phytoene/squalene synthetase
MTAGSAAIPSPDADMTASLAEAITRSASRQTDLTIRLLVDRERRADAYRAYAYFRWLDDVLDAEAGADADPEIERLVRRRFLDRQRSLLDRCLRRERIRDPDPQEAMLVDLVQGADAADDGLESYLRNMMLVMDFDVRRRGHLVGAAELDEYTRWLAIAVTEAIAYFIGHDDATPHDETRYRAVSGAHALHMLRDTFDDLRAGYYNVPRELLETQSIGPGAVHCDAYRGWVRERVALARADLDAGRSYFARVESRRHRLAGLAYIARFEWLIEALERDDYRLRGTYRERASLATGLRLGGHVVWGMLGLGGPAAPSSALAAQRGGPR